MSAEIRFFTHSKIDKERWNNTIANAAFPTLFADYDVLTLASPKWCALILGDYDYVMPLPARTKIGLHYIFSPFAFPRCGIFSKNPISPQLVRDFVEKIPRRFIQIDLRLNDLNSGQLIEDKAISLVTYKLNLNRDYTELWNNFSTNTKRNIKTAEKLKLTLTDAVTLDEIIELFLNNRAKMTNLQQREKDYLFFQKMADLLTKRGNLQLLGVKNAQNELLAGACFVHDYDKIWFWFSGRDNAHAQSKPMFLIVNEVIKMQANSPKILDFDGSLNENVARFYSSFGSKKCIYPMLCYSRFHYLGGLVKFYKILREKSQKSFTFVRQKPQK